MTAICEGCPIRTKINTCCYVNPETGESKIVRFTRTGEEIQVCNFLGTDGYCEAYEERPDVCAVFYCDKALEVGMDSAGIYTPNLIQLTPRNEEV